MAPSETIDDLLERGRQRGFVTYDEIAPFIDLQTASAGAIEAFMRRLADAGIVLIEGGRC